MQDSRTAILVRELEDLDDEITLRSCELMEREAHGTTIRLMFDPVSEVHPLYIEVASPFARETWPVPADRGLDAFAHPFAYAP